MEYVPSKVPCPACGTEMQEEMHCTHEILKFKSEDVVACEYGVGLKCPVCHTEVIIPDSHYPIER